MARNEAYYNAEHDVYEFRGSSFGGCMHGLVMALNGAKKGSPSLKTRDRYAAGNRSEEAVKADLILAGAADKGKPRPGLLGVMWDAGPNLHSQRQVRGHYLSGPEACKWVCSDYPFPAKHDHCVVQCSLDGWGIGVHEFLARAACVYTEGCVDPAHTYQGFTPFIWEHKSVMKEKFPALLKCCPAEPYVLDPVLFRQLYNQYSWQLTAQGFGVHSMIWDVFRDDDPACNEVGGFSFLHPRVFFSVEVLTTVGEHYVPAGRHLFYMRHTPFDGSDVAARLGEVLRMWRAGEVLKCDSEYQCDWPLPAAPKRTGNGPILAPAPGGYKYQAPQTVVDLGALA